MNFNPIDILDIWYPKAAYPMGYVIFLYLI